MRLNSVELIRSDLGFDDMTDINAATVAALNAATVILEATLDTQFDQATVTDRFYVKVPPYMDGPTPRTEFRLSRGFLQVLASVTMAGTLAAFTTPDAIEYSASLFTDLEKGVVRDYVTAYSGSYVNIVYTSGFPVDPTDDNSYDLTVVPAWLQRAALLQAKILLADSPTLEGAAVKIDVKTLKTELQYLVAKKLRYAPVALLPV